MFRVRMIAGTGKNMWIALAILVTLFSCTEHKQGNQFQLKWTSQNVSSIPYRLRLQKFEKVNLVINSGFEEGKYYEFNAKSQPFDILGWKKTSERVEWVNVESPDYKQDEAYNGKHAIKIINLHADETEEQGEGIESDFIRVIPGKYEFSVQVRLENIKSAKARLGTRLYDAIDLRLIYFDKNKLEINPNIYYPDYHSFINSGFKGYSFSNFQEIDSLGWTKVFCESAYPPFPTGYIPDDTRFVKIFLGLKGSGTFWIDDINYHYTRDNFNLAEKISGSFESKPEIYRTLIPTPKTVDAKEPFELHPKGDSLLADVLITGSKNLPTAAFVSYLKTKMPGYRIVHKPGIRENEFHEYGLIFRFSMDKSNKTINADTLIPKNTDFYHILPSALQNNLIQVHSTSVSSAWMALCNVSQLFNKTNQTYFSAEIRNWPTFSERNLIIPFKIQSLLDKWPELNGYNNIFVQDHQRMGNTQFFRYSGYSSSINPVRGKNTGPFPVIYVESDTSENKLDERYMDGVKQLILQAKKKGETPIYFQPAWNTLLNIDARKNLTERFIYRNHTLLQQFDQFIWAGTSEPQAKFDQLDYYRVKQLIPIPLSFKHTLAPPVFGEDTLQILKEFIPVFPKENFEQDRDQFVSVSTNSVFLNIMALLALDYLWSPQLYDAEKSLYNALVHKFSRPDAVELIQYSTRGIILTQLIAEKRKNHSLDRWSRQEVNIAGDFKSSVISINASGTIPEHIKDEINHTHDILTGYVPDSDH